ncbi:MAG: helix-turn-helix transcriptional regulator [Ruminococcus sp.]|nr:helix-turn-helix transcriptional regulator [Ruminococcus sp.]
MNIANLKAEIARRNLSVPQLAKLINMDKKTMYSRINGQTDFKQSEIASISKVLELKQEEILSIFFADVVS